jgi:hypothetical protein
VRRGLISVAIFVAFAVIYTLSRHAISPTTTTTTAPTTTTTIATTTSTIPTSAMCQGSAFSGVYNEGEGAAGTIQASVTLTKATPGTCSVQGWPVLTLQDKTGAVLPVNLSDGSFQFTTAKANAAPKLLVLKQGSVTNFSLAYQDVPTNNTVCDNAVTVNVQFSAGGSAVPLTPPSPVQPCDNGKVWLSPFY